MQTKIPAERKQEQNKMWTSILCLSSLVVYIDAQTAEQLAAIDTNVAAVQQEILEAMDECRMTVKPSARNMLKMKWSPDAAQTAERYAKQCQFKHSKEIQRTIPGFTCGEILYMGSHFVSWTKVIKSFCNEQKDFEYEKGKTSPQAITEDFTQVAIVQTSECLNRLTPNLEHLNIECPANSCKYKNLISNCPAFQERCDNVQILAFCEGMCKCPNAIV
ncbi:cysteine-rich venom protein latisemin-like [Dendropsophus ebraccatus]|uniref:cysteine-rich venom protein latisemin-like n=1 Tax=Dendropsophus ebraccatus TaxID=150705 RepID=UPI0038312125